MVKRENVACSRESRNVTAQFFPRKYLHPLTQYSFFLSFYKTQRVLDVLFLVALKLIIVASCQDSKRSAVARQA